MSDYVRSLRARIGHDFLLLPGVVALIRDERGRLLLVQHVEGRWQLPGGAVDPDEDPRAALRRECREEAGVDVELLEIADVVGGPQHRSTYDNGDEVGFVLIAFAATIVGGSPQPSDDETRAVAWFEPDELDALDLRPSTRATLQKLLA